MPVEQYQRMQGAQHSYTIDYGEGWYIIQRDGKVLKHISSPIEMGVVAKDISLALTRDTAVADIENLTGIDE
jgi:hypothetical protein